MISQFLISFFKILLSSTLIICLLILIALQWPGIWLGPKTLEFARDRINGSNLSLELDWNETEVETNPTGFFSNRVLFKWQDFCLEQKNQVEMCFKTLALGFAYDLLAFEITELGPLRGGQGRLRYHSQPDSTEPQSDFEFSSLPGWLENAELKPIFVEVNPYHIQFGKRDFSGIFEVQSTSRANLDGESQTITSSIEDQKWGSLEARFTSQTDQLHGPWRMHFSSDLNLSQNSQIVANGRLIPDGSGFNYKVQTVFSSRESKANLTSSGRYEGQKLSGAIHGSLNLGRRFQISNCDFGVARNFRKIDFQSDCPIYLPLGQFQKIKSTRSDLERYSIGAVLKSHIEIPYPFNLSKIVSGAIDLRPDFKIGNLAQENGVLRTEFELKPSDWPHFENLKSNLDFSVNISRFKYLERTFRDSSLAVPAPFAVLEGSVSLTAQGEFDQNGGSLNSSLRTRLDSEHQHFHTQSKAQARLELVNLNLKKISITSDIDLRRVSLVLPPIESAPPSQFLPDPRFKDEALTHFPFGDNEAESKRFDVDYRIRVHTPQKRPLQLISNVADGPVTLSLDFVFQDDRPIFGKLSLDPFEYEIAGVKSALGGYEIALRITDFQTIGRGHIISEEASQTGVVYAPDPSDSAFRPQPKLPIALLELATVMGMKDPLSLAVVEQFDPNPPQSQSSANKIPLQIRRRY